MLLPECAPQRLADAAGKADARHLQHHLLRRDRLGAEHRAQVAPCLAARLDTSRPHLVPGPLRLEDNRGRHREVGGRVAVALRLRSCDERCGIGVAPAHDRSYDALLVLRTHVEEPGAFRRAQPLMVYSRVA